MILVLRSKVLFCFILPPRARKKFVPGISKEPIWLCLPILPLENAELWIEAPLDEGFGFEEGFVRALQSPYPWSKWLTGEPRPVLAHNVP